MIRLLFVGDGKRDSAMMPPLVERLLSTTLIGCVQTWSDARLHGKGYTRKLLFVIRQAWDARIDGVVATVDTDTAQRGKRLKELKKGRKGRQDEGFSVPAALGEATPHAEAWLLDDPTSVREGLQLAAACAVPRPSECEYPKETFESIVSRSVFAAHIQDGYSAIASRVDPKRCLNAKTTGFRAFMKDVQHEFKTCGEGRGDG